MTVARILNSKGHDVVTLSVDSTIGDVVRLLADKRIGVVVIATGGKTVEGIVSERDVVRALAKNGSAALEDKVSTYMTRSVTFCQETDTVSNVMETMSTGRFRHLPVVENGKLAGLISIGDVVSNKLRQAEKDAEEMRSYINTI